MQDGPEVGLICHLSRTYGRVTEVDQGPIAIIAETRAKKADQGLKADPARAG